MSHDSVTIRTVDASDSALQPAILSLLALLRPNTTRRQLERVLRGDNGRGVPKALACWHGPSIVGIALYRVTVTTRGDILFVEDLIIEPAFRRAGLAHRLVATIIDEARQFDCTAIELNTGKTNLAAQRFYAKENFTEPALHLRRELASSQDS